MTIMLKSSSPQPPLVIDVEQKDGEVRLTYMGHAFVVCHTNKEGKHLVEIRDVDTGVFHSAEIPIMCWRR